MSGMRRVACLALVLLAALVFAGTAAAFDGSTPLVGTTGIVSATVTPAGASVTANVGVSSPVAPAVSPTVSLTTVTPTVSTSVQASASASASGTQVSVPSTVSVPQRPVPPAPATAADPAPASAAPESRAAALGAVDRIVPAQRPAPVKPSSRVVRPVRGAHHLAATAHLGRIAAPTKHVVVHATKRQATGAPIPQNLGGERQPSPAGAGSVGGGSGIAFAALFATFLFLAAPRCGRRLRTIAELARPPALFSLLERPG
jgi:hypothetical protein